MMREDVQRNAFGAFGESGDPQRILHLARRWNAGYEGFFDWAAQLRGIGVPAEYRHLLECLARFVDGPIEQYRTFLREFVAQVDRIPSAIAAGETLNVEMTLALEITDESSTAFNDELERLTAELGLA